MIRKIIPLMAIGCLSIAANSHANESFLPDHSVMFYWAMPIDSGAKDSQKLSYGLRLDSIPEVSTSGLRGSAFKIKPASIDFEISKGGIKSLKFSGHNVLHSSAADLDF